MACFLITPGWYDDVMRTFDISQLQQGTASGKSTTSGRQEFVHSLVCRCNSTLAPAHGADRANYFQHCPDRKDWRDTCIPYNTSSQKISQERPSLDLLDGTLKRESAHGPICWNPVLWVCLVTFYQADICLMADEPTRSGIITIWITPSAKIEFRVGCQSIQW